MRATRARSQKIALIAETLAELGPNEIAPGAVYLSGELPQGRIGVGYAILAELSQRPPAAVASLDVSKLDAALSAIASLAGAGSSHARRAELASIFERATQAEQRFLHGLLVGELRQGALAGLMVEALARAAHVAAGSVRRALMLSGSLADTARAALLGGAEALAAFRLEPLRPVLPMLAQTADGVEQAFAEHRALAVEFKLDGARVQLRRAGETVRVFSRKLNDVTAAVPELVEMALALPLHDVVLDGEVVALRRDGRPEPFQTTMRRFGRRQDVAALRRELPLVPFFFDCLHLDGDDLLDEESTARFTALERALPAAALIPRRVARSADDVADWLRQSLASGHEGVMLKALDSPYEAGRRGASWLKLKPVHTLDLVVLAVEWGSGRRQGYLSNLHLGARGQDGGFVMLGKTFKGMTDELLRWQTEELNRLRVGEEGHVVMVRPELVVEVAFDGVQKSPQYPGGLALRFARVRRYRTDKTPAEADTLATVRALYEQGLGRRP